MKKSDGEDAQVPPTRQTGDESATGVALADQTIPSGDDRGSKTEIEGGAPRPDVEKPQPVGAQAEPARFTSNGQLPHNHVPTPTGSMPVGATGLSVEDARAKVAEVQAEHDDYVMRKGDRRRLAKETVQRLHPTELRAIADQRGYALAEGSVRAIRESFLAEQDKDTEIDEREKRVASARKGTKKRAGKKSSRRRR